MANHLRKDFENKFVFVRFKPLTYDMENLTNYVISDLLTTLNGNGILPFSGMLVSRLAAKNGKIGFLTDLFAHTSDNTYKLLEAFCHDIDRIKQKNGKQVCIMFEDIDRSFDFNVLARIFSISE